MKHQMNIGSKISLGIAALCAAILAIGGVGLWTSEGLNGTVDTIVRVQNKKTLLMGDVRSAAQEILAAQRGVLLRSMVNDPSRVRTYREVAQKAAQQLEADLKTLDPLLETDSSRQSLQKLRSSHAEWTHLTAEFDRLVDSQKHDDAQKLQAEVLRPVFDAMTTEADNMFRAQSSVMARLEQDGERQATTSRWAVSIMTLAGLGLGVVVVFVTRSAMRGLRRLATDIGDGAEQVAAAAGQVSGSSQSLAQGSSEQAASLEETSASTEEISSMTRKNEENARTASDETTSADKLLQETNQKLEQMIASMRDINASSEKIGRIIKVIDEIAFQTNILALNAAVEAARAGEAGMGFAVVADEVRNLAQRCAQAARDTSQLIEESITRSGEGKVKLDEVASCVGKVVDNASHIKLLANEVHVGSQEQARGIEQIAKAVAQMQQVTQSTAASAEQGASAGEEMSAQAETLTQAVQRLRVLVGDEAGDRQPAVRPEVRHARAPGRHPAIRPNRSPSSPAPRPMTPAPAEANDTVKVAAARTEIPLEGDFRDF